MLDVITQDVRYALRALRASALRENLSQLPGHFLGLIGAAVRSPNLAPVPVGVHFPGELAGEHPVRFDPISERLQREAYT